MPTASDMNIVVKRLTPAELDVKKRRFHTILPASRIMRADIVRFIMINARADKRNLLTRVGITFDLAGGDYLSEKGFSFATGKL